MLVVLDGVSNTDDSDVGVPGRRARPRARCCGRRSRAGWAPPRAALAAVTKVFADAAAARQRRGRRARPRRASTNPPSATFVAAVARGHLLAYANIGDSRAYWLPDGAPGVQLSVDDSAAQEQIAAGALRAEAESVAEAHAITRWLGRDAPDLMPRVGELQAVEPGWLLVCSDGLWNYASEPDALAAQIRAAGTTEPAALALALVGVRQRPGRTGQHHRRAGPGRGAAGRMRPPHRQHPSSDQEESRWLSSPPPSTRTSSCPTEARTSTRSSRSPAAGAGTAGPDRRRRRRRDHHRRHVRVDGRSTTMEARQAGGPGGAGRDRRRHLVRRRRRHRPGRPRLPAGAVGAGHGADGRRDPRRGRRGDRSPSRPAAAPRSAPGSTWPGRSSPRCPR